MFQSEPAMNKVKKMYCDEMVVTSTVKMLISLN